jgi:tetratricopeptide (TPR) repeat protein
MKEEDPLSPERNRADGLMSAGRPAEAVPIYRKLVAGHPDQDSLLLTLAWALHDSGETAEAAVYFEQLFRKELSRKLFTGFAYDELVRIYREGKNGEALVSVCERAAAAQPEDIGLLRTLGEACLTAGKADEAVRVFQKLTELEPDAPENWCSFGEGWLAAGEPAQAETAYNKAAEIDRAAETLFFSRLADGLLRAGYPERATAVWERCLAARSDEPFSWMGLGDVLIRLGKPDAAAEAYSRAANLRPLAAGGVWNRLGHGLTKEGLNSHAAAAFAKAIAAEPENPFYSLRLAEAYAAQGRDDLAADALRRVEALKPSPPGR